jgi:2-polyprenyl-6-methoxyphenol hydroxylase-like FAD-dependent oxidoreductase
MRRYVERLPNVRIRSQIVVRALTTRLEPTGALTVSGVRGEDPKGPTELTADIVIDSTGKTGSLIDGLVERGVALGEESEAAGILYFTRHYRLRPGQREPERDADAPATGDLDYLKFGLFPGDSGCFSITLSVPEIEHEMRMAIVHPDVWDHAVAAIPGLRPWTDPDRSAPTSKVFGMGNLQSRWRDFGHERGAGPLNFFAVGDTAIRTNPLYGRGCSFAAAQAYILKAVLAQELAPAERALAYARQLRLELHPYYEAMRKQDRQAVRRAEHQLTPSYKPRLKSRMMKRFLADAVTPAIRHDVELLREAMRSFHMLEHPEAWLKRPANLIKVLAYWARGKRRNAGAYPANPGPTRAEMMSALGLSAQADIDRLAQARAAA